MSRPITLIVFVIVAALCSGCGAPGIPEYPVSGRVRLEDGTPVQTGTVEFTSVSGDHTARGKIDHEGRFAFSTTEGEHLAVVIQLVLTEDLPLHEHDHGPTLDPDFAHYRRSGLRFTVDPEGENNFDVVVREINASRSAK
jgi:hypothetical protein